MGNVSEMAPVSGADTTGDPIWVSNVGARAQHRQVLLAFGLLLCLSALAIGVYWLWFRGLEPVSLPARSGRPGGIELSYFAGETFSNPLGTRIVPGVAYVAFEPPNKTHSGPYGVRWKGLLFFPETRKSLLCTESDASVKVYLHGREVLADWRPHRRRRRCADVRVIKGWHPLRVDLVVRKPKVILGLLREPYRDTNPFLRKPATVDNAAHIRPAYFCCRP